MRFKIRRNKVCPNRLNIEKDGQRCVLFLGEESCLMLLLEGVSDKTIKAAGEIYEACIHIFGKHEPYGLACATRCDILEYGDEFLVDADFFIKTISEEKVIEFIERFGDKKSRTLIPAILSYNSRKKEIMRLLKRYDEEKYISYITTITYSKQKEEPYDMYFDFFGCPIEEDKKIEEKFWDWFPENY